MGRKRKEVRRQGKRVPSPDRMNISRPDDEDKPDSHNRKTVLAVCLFLLIIALIVFGQTVTHDFVTRDAATSATTPGRSTSSICRRWMFLMQTYNHGSTDSSMSWIENSEPVR